MKKLSVLTRTVLVGGAVIAASLVGGIAIPHTAAGEAQASPNVPVAGVLYLGSNFGGTSSNCQGLDGYADLHLGADVTVYGADGTIVASTQIAATSTLEGPCALLWSVPKGVLREAGPFQYEVSHRGRLSFSAEDALGGLLISSIGN